MQQPRAAIYLSSGARRIVLIVFLIGFASIPAMASPNCATLTNSSAGNSGIKSASSVLVPASGRNAAYCQVNLLYGTNPNQNIHIRVGLPLNSSDGGSGGVQGAWNGRTEGLGGGGCSGNLNVTLAPARTWVIAEETVNLESMPTAHTTCNLSRTSFATPSSSR
jgi:hypothetical protein